LEIGIISYYDVFPPNFGGAVRTFQIAKNLGALGCRVHLFTPAAESKPIELKNVEVHRSKELNDVPPAGLKDVATVLKLFRSLIKTMKRMDCFANMEIVQSEGLVCAPYSLMFKKLLAKRAVLDEHAISSVLQYRLSKMSKNNWKRTFLLETLACRNADHVLSVSPFEKKTIETLFSIKPSKVTVIPNGVDINHFFSNEEGKEKVRTKYGLHDVPVILFLAKLNYFPNVDALQIILSEIYPRVKELVPEAVFMVVGTHPPSWLKSKDDFIVTGEVDDVAPYVNAADVCIDIKTGENIVVEDSWERFAEWIARLIRDQDLALRIGKNARTLAQEQFDWNGIVRQLLAVYRNITTN